MTATPQNFDIFSVTGLIHYYVSLVSNVYQFQCYHMIHTCTATSESMRITPDNIRVSSQWGTIQDHKISLHMVVQSLVLAHLHSSCQELTYTAL